MAGLAQGWLSRKGREREREMRERERERETETETETETEREREEYRTADAGQDRRGGAKEQDDR